MIFLTCIGSFLSLGLRIFKIISCVEGTDSEDGNVTRRNGFFFFVFKYFGGPFGLLYRFSVRRSNDEWVDRFVTFSVDCLETLHDRGFFRLTKLFLQFVE